jgi:hypothetical protein
MACRLVSPYYKGQLFIGMNKENAFRRQQPFG